MGVLTIEVRPNTHNTHTNSNVEIYYHAVTKYKTHILYVIVCTESDDG